MGYSTDEIKQTAHIKEVAERLSLPSDGKRYACKACDNGRAKGFHLELYTNGQQRGKWEAFKCHRCGAGGTCIDLVMHSLGVDFKVAAERLGAWSNLTPKDRFDTKTGEWKPAPKREQEENKERSFSMRPNAITETRVFRELKTADFRVYDWLSTNGGPNWWTCLAGEEAIARGAGYSVRHTRRVLKHLEEVGLIERYYLPGTGLHRPKGTRRLKDGEIWDHAIKRQATAKAKPMKAAPIL